jgi:hypothetical protein
MISAREFFLIAPCSFLVRFPVRMWRDPRLSLPELASRLALEGHSAPQRPIRDAKYPENFPVHGNSVSGTGSHESPHTASDRAGRRHLRPSRSCPGNVPFLVALSRVRSPISGTVRGGRFPLPATSRPFVSQSMRTSAGAHRAAREQDSRATGLAMRRPLTSRVPPLPHALEYVSKTDHETREIDGRLPVARKGSLSD